MEGSPRREYSQKRIKKKDAARNTKQMKGGATEDEEGVPFRQAGGETTESFLHEIVIRRF